MNTSALFEMLAARAATSGDPTLVDTLTRVRGAMEDGSDQATQALLAQLGNSNPMASLLATQFAERRARAAAAPEPTIIDMSPRLGELESEVAALRDQADTLAAALGACSLCWGHDPRCRACRGRGSPGFAVPDEDAFNELVLPAVRTMRRQVTSPRSHTAAPVRHAETQTS